MTKTEQLLEQWEQNYKKGLLSFWILLSLAEEAQYAYAMKEHIEALSLGSMSADENSIYRALRRFVQEGLVASEMRPSELGPDRRYFELSAKGRALLAGFIERNLSVFNHAAVKKAMNKIRNSQKAKNKERR